MSPDPIDAFILRTKFDDHGLVPAVAQQWDSGEVLMMAWMTADTLRETLASGRGVYFSRSRGQRWAKGDTSGHVQAVREVRLDCDGDTVLLLVDQSGGACHTGDRTCFEADRLVLDPKEGR
jgi:phosphoribosyl-AMP cyclohydrolase